MNIYDLKIFLKLFIRVIAVIILLLVLTCLALDAQKIRRREKISVSDLMKCIVSASYSVIALVVFL